METTMPSIGFSPERYQVVDATLDSMCQYVEALKVEYDVTGSTETYWRMKRTAIALDRLRFELRQEHDPQPIPQALQPALAADLHHIHEVLRELAHEFDTTARTSGGDTALYESIVHAIGSVVMLRDAFTRVTRVQFTQAARQSEEDRAAMT
jgi:hypothetical protein